MVLRCGRIGVKRLKKTTTPARCFGIWILDDANWGVEFPSDLHSPWSIHWHVDFVHCDYYKANLVMIEADDLTK